MKKSVKILIIVLCLIILGLVTFIVVDKFIIKESNVNTIVTENSTETSNELKHNPKNSTIIDSYIGNTYVNTDYSEQQIKINSISNNTLNFDLVIGDDYGDYTVNANASIEKNKASFNIENMLMRGTLTFQDEKIIMDITEGSNQFFNTGDRFEYIKLSQNTNTTSQQTDLIISDYAKEYKKIIDKVETENPDTDIKCDLIYFNDDNIPDLVIDDGGISLYVYENGTIYTLMDHEAYGIGGSKYYNYLEKKGVIYNYGNSFADAFAGMISCDTYYILNSEYKFETISHMYPMAEDPDDEELQKQLEKYEEYYYDDNKISEQDYNSILKEFSISTNENDYKFLQGTQAVDEVERYLFE